MNKEQLDTWMSKLGQAWERGDADAAAALFSTDVSYQEDPFQPPLRGREAVRAYWAEVPLIQRDIHFSFETLAVTPDGGVFHWWVSFTRIPTNASVRIDGAQLIKLNAEGLCYELREWWMRDERSAELASLQCKPVKHSTFLHLEADYRCGRACYDYHD